MTSVDVAEKFGESFGSRVPRSAKGRSPQTVDSLCQIIGWAFECLFVSTTLLAMPHIKAFDSCEWATLLSNSPEPSTSIGRTASTRLPSRPNQIVL